LNPAYCKALKLCRAKYHCIPNLALEIKRLRSRHSHLVISDLTEDCERDLIDVHIPGYEELSHDIGTIVGYGRPPCKLEVRAGQMQYFETQLQFSADTLKADAENGPLFDIATQLRWMRG